MFSRELCGWINACSLNECVVVCMSDAQQRSGILSLVCPLGLPPSFPTFPGPEKNTLARV